MLNLSFDNSSVETQKSDSSIDWCHYNLDCNVTAILIVEPLLWFESQIQVAFRWISPVAKISILNDEVWHIRGGSMIFGLGVQISLLGGGGGARGRERERGSIFFCEIPFENEIIMAQEGVRLNPPNPLWICHCIFCHYGKDCDRHLVGHLDIF